MKKKFKVLIFVAIMVLFGSFLLGLLISTASNLIFQKNIIDPPESSNNLVDLLINSHYLLFTHFIVYPLGSCSFEPGTGLDYVCFFKLFSWILIIQIVIYTLVGILIFGKGKEKVMAPKVEEKPTENILPAIKPAEQTITEEKQPTTTENKEQIQQ